MNAYFTASQKLSMWVGQPIESLCLYLSDLLKTWYKEGGMEREHAAVTSEKPPNEAF